MRPPQPETCDKFISWWMSQPTSDTLDPKTHS
jgi:hypothetical protein